MLRQREHGAEQPYWPIGPFKVRLPFLHYRWEFPEMIQALLMFVVSLGMIPLLQQYLGLPYEAALAGVVICGIGFMLPALLGVPLVPGWITPAIPIVLLYLQNFEPGPEAMKAMMALQIEVFIIFLFLGITGLGNKLVTAIPNSLKAGIIIGAGIAAMMGELKAGGRVEGAPVSIIIGAVIAAYILFSISFKSVVLKNKVAKMVANFGMVPGLLVAMAVGWILGEFPMPTIEWGITNPDFALLFSHLPINIGWPGWDMFLLAIPTAIIAYVIAFGDILVGFTLVQRADHLRTDEKIELNVTRVHLVTAIRNALHGFIAPWPGLAGPLWTPHSGHDRRTLRSGAQGHGFALWRPGHLLDRRLPGAVHPASSDDVPPCSAAGAFAHPHPHRLYLHHGGNGGTKELHPARRCRHRGRNSRHARPEGHHLRHRRRSGALLPHRAAECGRAQRRRSLAHLKRHLGYRGR